MYIYKIKDSGSCDRCSNPNETILHLFWECSSSKRFWVELQRKLSLHALFTSEEIILGKIKRDASLSVASIRLCILIGKHFIWQCRSNGHTVDVSSFFVTLNLTRYLLVERYIAVCKGNMEKFATVFGNLIDMIELCVV